METILLLSVAVLGLGGVYFLISVGLALIFGLMDVLNLTHALSVTLGAYIAWAVMRYFSFISSEDLRFVIAIGISVVANFALAAAIERIFIRKFYGDHLRQIFVTLGVTACGTAMLGAYFTYDVQTYLVPDFLKKVIQVGDARLPVSNIVLGAIAGLTLVGLSLFLRRTHYGLIIRAGVDNRSMVNVMGINVRSSFTQVFAIGGGLAGLGGALASVYFPGITPNLGLNLMILCFVVVILGGMKSLSGIAWAAIAVAGVQIISDFYLPGGVGSVAVFVILFIALICKLVRFD